MFSEAAPEPIRGGFFHRYPERPRLLDFEAVFVRFRRLFSALTRVIFPAIFRQALAKPAALITPFANV
jgi:hypothetical protein